MRSRITAATLTCCCVAALLAAGAALAQTPSDDTVAGGYAVEDVAPRQVPADSWEGRWHIAMSNDEYEAAEEAASQWILQVEKTEGPNAAALIEPLKLRGYAREIQEMFDAARVDYQRAVDIAETNLGAFAPELVEPLTAIGRTLMATDRHEEAEGPLLRAQGITHRNLGIFSPKQSIILEHLTHAYQQQGKLISADQQQYLALSASEKAYGPDAPEHVPALHNWARWNATLGRFAKVGTSLRRALEILEQTYGPNDLRLLETLELMVDTYRYHPSRAHAREGESALQRMVDIYEAQPQVDKSDLVAAQTRMGDWYMLARSRNRAIEQYSQTLDSARATGIDPELIDRFYGDPKILYLDRSEQEFFGRSPNGTLSEPGYIVVEFDVNKSGKTARIKVVEDTIGNPAIASAAMDRVRSAVYRPKFVDGQPVATHGLQNLFEVRHGGKGLILGMAYVPEETRK